MRLTDGDRLAIHRAQHTAHECTVNILVLPGKHGTCGTIESHSSSICIQQGGLANRRNHAIKWHDVTGSRHPQRQIGIAELFEIINLEYTLMRDISLASVSSIVHDQGTRILLLLDDSRHFRISITRRRCLAGISIPHHFFHQIVRIEFSHIISHIVGINHVEIVVAIITHEHQGILPSSSILVLHVVDGLVNQDLCLCSRCHRESSHGYILQLCTRVSTLAFAYDT